MSKGYPACWLAAPRELCPGRAYTAFPEGAAGASQELSGMLKKEWSGVVWKEIRKVQEAFRDVGQKMRGGRGEWKASDSVCPHS